MAKYATQPAGGSRINWGHPLTRGLVDAWVFNEGGGQGQGYAKTLTNGGEYATQSGGYWATASAGRGRLYGTSFDRFANSTARSITGEVTIAAGFTSTLANPSGVQIVGKRNQAGGASGIDWALLIDGTDGVYFQWTNGGTFVSTANTAGLGAVPARAYMSAVGTRPAAADSAKLYKNGVLIRERTGLATPTSIGTPITFGAANDGSLLFDGIVHWAYLWQRELSEAEVQSLNANPYALLAPVSPRRFFTGIAAAASSKAYYYAQTQGLR